MKGNTGIIIVSIIGLAAIGVLGSMLWAPSPSYTVLETPDRGESIATSSPGMTIRHVSTPKDVKGIYMSSWIAGDSTLRAKLVDLITSTELNSVVIDIKDYTGQVSYDVDDPIVKSIGSVHVRVPDMKEFIAALHEHNIYVIGRIATFQDPFLVKTHPEYAVKTKAGEVWKDRKGITWIDAGARPAWEYYAALGAASYAAGFDEINYDYIRFPSDGDMVDIAFPYSDLNKETRKKSDVLSDFFAFLDTSLRSKKIPISADLFGMTTSNTDDLGIGQMIEPALLHFDYVAPMIYPSHYPKNFNGWATPNTKPYEVIQYTLTKGLDRVKALNMSLADASSTRAALTTLATTTPSMVQGIERTYLANAIDVIGRDIHLATTTQVHAQQIRPWLQDFSIYGVHYGAAEVRAQIQATNDVGLNGWLLWNASNRYTKEALLPEDHQDHPTSVTVDNSVAKP